MAEGRLDVRREGSQKKRGRWSGDGKDVDRCLKEAKKRGTFQFFFDLGSSISRCIERNICSFS